MKIQRQRLEAIEKIQREQWRDRRDIERRSWKLREGRKEGERWREHREREPEVKRRRTIKNYTCELVHSSRVQISSQLFWLCQEIYKFNTSVSHKKTTRKALCLSLPSLSGALYTFLCAFEDISFQIIADAGGTQLDLRKDFPRSGDSWLQAGVGPSFPPFLINPNCQDVTVGVVAVD